MCKLNLIHLRSILLLSVIFLLTHQSLFSQVSNFKGQSLFIYNFAKHIKWPNAPQEYTIGVVGNSDFYKELETTLRGKQIDGSYFKVKTITSMNQVAECQIVYLPSSSSKEITSLISAVGKKEILVITENDLIEKGAGISFLFVDNKIRFRLNQSLLIKHGLQVSSGLVTLAAK